MSYNPDIDLKSILQHNGSIYPVYILSRVVHELVAFCSQTMPKEALAFLLGNRVSMANNQLIEFTKITDWVTGSVQSTHVSANFTTEGLQHANLFLDEKYGRNRERNSQSPKIIGIVHSHPFGVEPHFSNTDLTTFLNFPYDTLGNVFILIDPVSKPPFFKVFKILRKNDEKILQHVPWIEYSPFSHDIKVSESDFDEEKHDLEIKEHNNMKNLEKGDNIDNKQHQFDENDDPFLPPDVEDLSGKKRTKKQSNIREFFN